MQCLKISAQLNVLEGSVSSINPIPPVYLDLATTDGEWE